MATLFTTACYWRPGETLKLAVSDCIAPVLGGGRHGRWSFRLHFQESQSLGSKTKEFDEIGLVDAAPYKQFAEFLQHLAQERNTSEPLFDISAKTWHHIILSALAWFEVDRKIVLYILRHTGASNDMLFER